MLKIRTSLSSTLGGNIELRMIIDCHESHELPAQIKHRRKETKLWQRDWTNVQPPLSRLEVASISYPFTVFVLAQAAGLMIDHALLQAGDLASAAVPPNRASATAWTKAVLRDVSGVGRPSETDAGLSHCIVLRPMMLYHGWSWVHSVIMLECCRTKNSTLKLKTSLKLGTQLAS